MGSELIRVMAVDNDIGNNSVVRYHIVTIQYIRLQSNDTEDMGDIFIIGTAASLSSSSSPIHTDTLTRGLVWGRRPTADRCQYIWDLVIQQIT